MVFVLAIFFCSCNKGCNNSDNLLQEGTDDIALNIDSIRAIAKKDSLFNDSISKALKITIKENKLSPEVRKKVDMIVQKQKEESFLNDKSDKEIFDLYQSFVKDFNPKSSKSKEELRLWANDPFFQRMKNKNEWIEKVEELEELLDKKLR